MPDQVIPVQEPRPTTAPAANSTVAPIPVGVSAAEPARKGHPPPKRKQGSKAPERPRYMLLPLTAIVLGANVREIPDDEMLAALSDSIREAGGVKTPGIAFWNQRRQKYELIAGYRRFKASEKAGERRMPCLVYSRPIKPNEITLTQLTENENRVGLTPLEQARAFKKLFDGGMTQAQIAKHIGIPSQGRVSEYLKLLDLPLEIQAKVESGELSAKAAVRKAAKAAEPGTPPKSKRAVSTTLAWTDKATGTAIFIAGEAAPAPATLLPLLRAWMESLEATMFVASPALLSESIAEPPKS